MCVSVCLCVYSQDSLLMSGLYHAFSCVKSTQGLNTKWLRFTEPSETPPFSLILSHTVSFPLSIPLFYYFCLLCLYLTSPLPFFFFIKSLLAMSFSLPLSSVPLHSASLNHIQSVLLIPSYSWLQAQINLSSWWTDRLTGCCFTCTTLKEDGIRGKKRERRGGHVVFMSCLVPRYMKLLLHFMFFVLKCLCWI